FRMRQFQALSAAAMMPSIISVSYSYTLLSVSVKLSSRLLWRRSLRRVRIQYRPDTDRREINALGFPTCGILSEIVKRPTLVSQLRPPVHGYFGKIFGAGS